MDAIKEFVSEKISEMPKPEATFEDFDLKGVAMDGVSYLAKIAVSNPYPAPIPICEVDYSLKSDAREIVSGRMPDPGSLKAKQTTVIEVPLKVPHNIVLSLVKDVWLDWDIDYELNVTLIIDLPVIGDIKIPINQKGEIKLPSIKDFFKGGNDGDDKDKDDKN